MNLSSNQISSVGSEYFPRNYLEVLDLSSNLITTLPDLSSSRKLKKLYLNDNLIRVVSGIASLYELEELRLASNQLTSARIRLTDDNVLHTLDLSGNQINMVRVGDFTNLQNLKVLLLNNSKVEEIKLGALSPLVELILLDLSNNSISKIDFSEFLPAHRSLQALILNENQLTELDDRFDSLFISLSELVITNNRFNCSYLKHFLGTVKTHSRAFYLNTNFHRIPNIHGIDCEITSGELVFDNAPKYGFDSGYNVSVLVCLLCLTITNLVICATSIWFGRRKKEN